MPADRAPPPRRRSAHPVRTSSTSFLSENSSSDPLTSKGLASLDTSTLHLSYIGAYDALGSSAELTGTGDGRLFGRFFGPTWTVAEIDRSTAAILSQAPQPAVGILGNSGAFAFAFWGGAFFIFVSDGSVTDVYEYDPANATTNPG